MRYLIMLEPVETGFAVQVPDLAVSAFGETVDEARQTAVEAIKINLHEYHEQDMPVPSPRPVNDHLENPDFAGLLFAYVDVDEEREMQAA